MPKHDDLTTIKCGWNPPEHWVFGVCQGCGCDFLPKLRKQYWCYECRTPNGPIKLNFRPMNQRRLGVNEKHPIVQAMNDKALTMPELIQATGLSLIEIRRIASYSFVYPPKYPFVLKLCKALSASVEQLFPMAGPDRLAKYKRWEAEHGPRHTLP